MRERAGNGRPEGSADAGTAAVRGHLGGGRRGFGALDHAVCWAVVFLACAWAYHPYFFGDEITMLRETRAADGFAEALAYLSHYKPRLVFNSLWAWGITEAWPRSAFAAVNAVSIAAVCSFAAFIAGRWFGASRGQAWLLVAVILSTRFGAMFYFDYVCGIIDTLSAALLLGTVVAAVAAVRWRNPYGMALAVVLATATVLVHERYMAATFALACAVAAWTLLHRERGARSGPLAFAVVLALVPPAAFLGLTWLMDSRSVATGTAGREIALGLGTAKVFFTYLANVLLGMNFGKEWLVGALNMGSDAGRLWSWIFAAVFLAGWGAYAWTLRRDARGLSACVALLAMIGALVLIASLPGEERQESRWMYPAAVLVALLVFCTRSAAVRYLLLGAMLAVSSVHWLSGALDMVYNIQASRTARNLSDGVNGLLPPGRNAVVMGMEHSLWTLGDEEALQEFSQRNLGGKVRLRYHQPERDDRQWADMAFLRTGKVGVGERFALVMGMPLEIMLDPAVVEAGRGRYADCTFLGEGAGWKEWTWTATPEMAADGEGVVLPAAEQLVGTRPLPAGELDGREIVYRARTLQPGAPSAMRLQVNWLDAEGGFVSTTIRVVEVGEASAEFRAPLAAPPGAATGLVYANLHDGQTRPVVLQEIYLVRPVVLELAPGGDWSGWHWSSPPERSGNGVVLRSAATVTGTVEVDASLIDRRTLVYRARSLDPGTAPTMRLQVNWLDESGGFLGAQIQPVQAGERSANHAMLVVAPPAARKGFIYASLHDGVEQPVELESVAVVMSGAWPDAAAPAIRQDGPQSQAACRVPCEGPAEACVAAQ